MSLWMIPSDRKEWKKNFAEQQNGWNTQNWWWWQHEKMNWNENGQRWCGNEADRVKRKENKQKATNEIMQMRFLCAMRCGLCILYGVYCILECMARTPRTNATLKLPKNFHFPSIFSRSHRLSHVGWLSALRSSYFSFSKQHKPNRKKVVCCARLLTHAHTYHIQNYTWAKTFPSFA